MSTNNETELAAGRAAMASAEQLVAERDKTIAALGRQVDTIAKIMNDLLVGNQSAWIEWQHGNGAEAAMEWVKNSLAGCGTPNEDARWSKDAQAWYSANKADPFPTCFCGRPSNHLWMGQGFCCDVHYDQARTKATAEAAGKTGLPIFDGSSPDTEGGSCD